jgi:hypothetical protein
MNKEYFVLFLSIGLVTTGLHRLFLKEPSVSNVVPFLEVLAGILVWTRYRDVVLYMWMVGAILFSFLILFSQDMSTTYPDMFTVKRDPMSVYFHLTWALIILYILFQK